MFDKDVFDDLFYSALTELTADGLLRPSESLPEGKYKTDEQKGKRKCNIFRDVTSRERDEVRGDLLLPRSFRTIEVSANRRGR